MAKIERFEDLKTWQKARELNQRIYRVSGSTGFAKDYGLRDQIRRASISVMSNIAEGFERDGDKELAQFLSNAKSSCGEARSQLYTALDQKYITLDEFENLQQLCEKVSRMLSGFMAYLKTSKLRGRKFKPDLKT